MQGCDKTSSSSIGRLYTDHVESINNIYELQSVIHKLNIDKQKKTLLFKKTANDHAHELNNLKKELKELKLENDRLKIQNMSQKSIIKNLTSQYRSTKQAYNELQNLMKQVKGDEKSAIAEIVTISKKKEEYQKNFEDLSMAQQVLKQNGRTIWNLKKENLAIRTNYQQKIRQLELGLLQEKQSSKLQLSLIEEEKQKKLQKINQEIVFYRQHSDKVDLQNIALLHQINQLRRQLNFEQANIHHHLPPPNLIDSHFKNKYQELHHRFQNLLEQHNILKEASDPLQKQLRKLKEDYLTQENAFRQLENRFIKGGKEYKVINYTQQIEISKEPLLEELSKLRQILEKTEEHEKFNEQKIQKLQKQLKQLRQSEIKHLRKEMAYWREKANKSTQQNSTFQLIIQEQRAEIDKLEQLNNKINIEKKQMQLTIEQNQTTKICTKQNKQKQCSKCYTFNHTMQNRIQQYETDNKQLNKEKQKLQNDLKLIENKLRNTMKEKYELERQVNWQIERNKNKKNLDRNQCEEWKNKYLREKQMFQHESKQFQQKMKELSEINNVLEKCQNRRREIKMRENQEQKIKQSNSKKQGDQKGTQRTRGSVYINQIEDKLNRIKKQNEDFKKMSKH